MGFICFLVLLTLYYLQNKIAFLVGGNWFLSPAKKRKRKKKICFFFLCVKYLAIEDNKKHPYGFGDFMGTDRQTGFAIYSNDTGCYYFSFSFFISSIKEIGIMSCQFFSGAGNENLVRSTMVSLLSTSPYS